MAMFALSAIPPRIETARLILRPFTVNDVNDVYAYASDPEVARYTRFEPHPNRDTTREWMNSVLLNETGDKYLFALEHRDSHAVMGSCGIRGIHREHSKGEMGWVLRRDHWSQGYATEAVRAVIGFGFQQAKLN